ncbi:MAG: inner-rane translocator, partial [Ramlibacter sp.]|nr:inner-rane translocator [Ramlibacter sp.]
MRFLFKTDYGQDLKLAKHGGQVFWYSLLCLWLLAAPWLLSEYLLAQLTFILIYGIVGLGLMILAGFTGLFSIGHAAFFGVGAYAQAVLTGMGWPFPLALVTGAVLAAAVGVIVGLPALRVKGIYLGIATLSCGFIVAEVVARWESVTGGNAGKTVGPVKMFGWTAGNGSAFYFVCLVVAVL